jgi:hypothetical protein
MEDETESIYEFFLDCGRMGELEGYFIATDKNVLDFITKEPEVHFGEVLGKHSDISAHIKGEHITKLSSDATEIQLIRRIFQCTATVMGFNPLDFYALNWEGE